ncbi:MAG: hypothetical protein HUJ25_05900 [Crocinitomicaceae bacterium]|nr:hypothetical protein [Crocinitomicaceae bacterium]
MCKSVVLFFAFILLISTSLLAQETSRGVIVENKDENISLFIAEETKVKAFTQKGEKLKGRLYISTEEFIEIGSDEIALDDLSEIRGNDVNKLKKVRTTIYVATGLWIVSAATIIYALATATFDGLVSAFFITIPAASIVTIGAAGAYFDKKNFKRSEGWTFKAKLK